MHVPKAHLLDCYRRHIPDRDVLSPIFFILRTGCHCKALNKMNLRKCFTAHSRSRHRVQAGVFARSWDETLDDLIELTSLG